MYFVSKGQCIVNVVDETGVEHEGIRILEKGDHFGEVSLIYKTQRTATVLSRNYNTLAKLRFERYIELRAEYPEYEDCMKKHVRQKYKDHKIRFLLEMISRVDYLAGSSQEILYDIIFNLQPKQYEKDSIVLQEDANAASIKFIENGVVEVVTHFEQNEF